MDSAPPRGGSTVRFREAKNKDPNRGTTTEETMQSFFCENCEAETPYEEDIYTITDIEVFQLTIVQEHLCQFCGWGTEDVVVEEMC